MGQWFIAVHGLLRVSRANGLLQLGGLEDVRMLVVDGNLVFKNLLDDQFHVGHSSLAFNQRARSLHDLEHTLLDERGEFELSADLVNDFFAFQCLYHFDSCTIPSTSCTVRSRSSLIT